MIIFFSLLPSIKYLSVTAQPARQKRSGRKRKNQRQIIIWMPRYMRSRPRILYARLIWGAKTRRVFIKLFKKRIFEKGGFANRKDLGFNGEMGREKTKLAEKCQRWKRSRRETIWAAAEWLVGLRRAVYSYQMSEMQKQKHALLFDASPDSLSQLLQMRA